jgi:hypothetical protein
MTDEMRAAESLVRHLAPSGLPVPILEPLALDESEWFLTAVEKGLIEFTNCNGSCTRTARGRPRTRDHFETGGGEPEHLFTVDGHSAALRRDYIPCVAAYARAVLDLGYDDIGATLFGQRATGRRLVNPFTTTTVRTGAEFPAADGSVHLQIEAKRERQLTRRLATAIDASGRLSALPRDFAREIEHIVPVGPRYLWLVGPNTIDPACHVFRVRVDGDDATFHRIDTVPAPA